MADETAIDSHTVARLSLFPSAQEADDLDEVLRHASDVIGELRTGSLMPKPYYELYMEVFDKLALLEMHLHAAVASGDISAQDLYERVQVGTKPRRKACRSWLSNGCPRRLVLNARAPTYCCSACQWCWFASTCS